MELRQGLHDLPGLHAEDRKRVALVFTWPMLRGEPKIAWLQMWFTLGVESKTIRVTPSAVGSFQGTSDTAGKRAIRSLAEQGIVEIIDRRGGQWMLYLNDPIEAAIARRARQGDGQSELNFGDEWHQILEDGGPENGPSVVSMQAPLPPTEAQPSAEAHAHPPSRTLDLEEEKFIKTSNLSPKEPSLGSEVRGSDRRFGGSAPTSADPHLQFITNRKEDLKRTEHRPPPPKKYDMGGGILSLLTPEGQLQRGAKIRELMKVIQAEVNDPDLYPSVAENAAAAVVDGDWPVSKFQGVLNSLNKARRTGLRVRPAVYFAKAAKKSMKESERSTK